MQTEDSLNLIPNSISRFRNISTSGSNIFQARLLYQTIITPSWKSNLCYTRMVKLQQKTEIIKKYPIFQSFGDKEIEDIAEKAAELNTNGH